MKYTAFPIYDFRSGLRLDREPWLLPANAFQVAENVYFYQGRIFKRRGYEAFGQTANGGVNVLATPPVMGLYELKTTAGTSTLLAFDKDFLYVYDPDADDWVGKGGYSGTPDWTGNEANLFQCVTIPKGQLGAADDLALITNNKDNLSVWDGTDITTLPPGAGAAANRPTSSLLNFIHKGRVIALNTVESGARYPQRARCSAVDSYTNWAGDVFVDAETGEKIQSAAIVQNELIVFFEESTWWLRYTGDYTLPFKWQKIDTKRGSYGPFSTVHTGLGAFTLGKTSWNGIQGLTVYRLDGIVSDITGQMNQESFKYAYGFMNERFSQYICAFASLTSTYPDRALCYNYDDHAFSLFTLPINVTGTWVLATSPTFDDYTALTFDEADFSFDDVTHTAGFSEIIMGDQSGYTWKLFSGSSDNGANILAQLKTKRLFPYEGHKARLGWIDFHGQSGSNFSFTVKLYKNSRTVPYLTRDIEMYTANEDKTVQRMKVGEVGRNHVIEIYDNSKDNTWVLDAIVPWFKRAGRLN